MGCCGSSEETDAKSLDKAISKSMKADKRKADSEIKLLLLGAGESGKSTIFKQMKIIHRNGYSPAECAKQKGIIYGNVLQNIRTLINACQTLGIPLESEDNRARSEQILSIPDQNIVLSPETILTPDLARDIDALWRDRGVQMCYTRKSEFQINENADYYFNDIIRIAAPDYSPNQQDVLRSRVKTVGIVEDEFVLEGYKFKLVDVGGQRNERRKWIHVFDDVTAIIFVTALSEYDQKLFEDQDMNRMIESLILFDEVCNMKYFKNTSIIIFFNKVDIFEQKIKSTDLNVCFPDYTGGCDFKKAEEFITTRFTELNKNPKRQIYSYSTCATNTENIKFVFNAVKNIILHNNLMEANLV